MHSKDFEKLKIRYMMNLITIEQLRKWVEINMSNPNRGITAQEFQEITHQSYLQ